ncbi:MAG TPA: diacylglycerol kinase family protein [Bryobacteraceae bacterium]|nr:diacylglycerol kinase family protein [Bryobacteraceae bacterium]
MKPAIRRAALIYNPASGQYSARRAAAIQDALDVLRSAEVETAEFETSTPGSGTACARRAIESGCDTVLACGGDGTVHEVVQSLVGTDVALGVVPLGTANALAADLGLIGPPSKAARKLLDARPARIPVGRIHYNDGNGNRDSRYFVVAAGIGADALLMSRMDAGLKRRLGYVLYLMEAFRIWATDPFPLFQAAFTRNGHDSARVAEVSQLLAVRVRSFGGVLRELAPGATLHNNTLDLLAFKTRNRLRYLSFLLAVIAGRHTFLRDIELWKATTVECQPRNGSSDRIFVEADGEVLGSLPVKIDVVPDALTVLIPQGAQP